MFTRFGDLPPELRLDIWELALRPRTYRGLHYLSVAECSEADIAAARECSEYREQLFRLGLPASPTSYHLNKILGVGQCSYTPHDSRLYKVWNHPGQEWFEGNRSMCAWDAGLETACLESRYVFLKALSRQNRYLQAKLRLIQIQHGNETAFFRVHSARDMIVLNFDDKNSFTNESDNWVRLLRRSPMYRLPGVVGNIALEYDPAWRLVPFSKLKEALTEPTALGVAVRVFSAWVRGESFGHCLWLVDRAMYSSDLLHSNEWPNRKVFSDQENYYIETNWEEHEFWSRTSAERCCAWAFVSRLKCWDLLRCLETKSPSRAMQSGHCCFRVLARVHAPGPGMLKKRLTS
ncbi:hypothetical protein HJFPF1_08725 [Paramyrothecium foliicola]|nr:hypothetical protein HJFPF1_08725 [Paramyrothecium foliicola]